MGQVTIYLDSETEARLKKAAKSSQTSVSKWVALMIQNQIKNEWPRDIENLVGCWKDDFPSLDEIRSNNVKDIKREDF